MNYILRDKRKIMTREELNQYKRKYYKLRRKLYRKQHNSYQKEYQTNDLNSEGLTKKCIRVRSKRILKRAHSLIPGYEIHHCFGYEDAEKFIYIPKELHLKIHQFLRDNNIPAHIDHFNAIRELIYAYTGYTYIHS